MSSADVLRRLLKLDLSTPESRRVLDNFLRFQGYGYFVSTLRGPDVLSFVNLLDKVRQRRREVLPLVVSGPLIGGFPGFGRDSDFRGALG